MALQQKHPYAHFNFLIEFDEGASEGPKAGFQEVSVLFHDTIPPRHGTPSPAHESITKITGINKATDVLMQRGIIDSTELNSWLDDIKHGKKGRTVVISSQSETLTSAPRKWKLRRARIIKHTSGPLNAKGTDVAIEELVIGVEQLALD
jgi:phage tail-like protein